MIYESVAMSVSEWEAKTLWVTDYLRIRFNEGWKLIKREGNVVYLCRPWREQK